MGRALGVPRLLKCAAFLALSEVLGGSFSSTTIGEGGTPDVDVAPLIFTCLALSMASLVASSLPACKALSSCSS
jgi:hypothetical protein